MASASFGNLSNAKKRQVDSVDAIRARPRMYLGSTDQNGLCRLVGLLVLEAIDGKALRIEPQDPRFRATQIEIAIHPDGFITVRDDGRGLPLEKAVPTFGPRFLSWAETIPTQIYVPAVNGLVIANALSAQLDLRIYRDGSLWEQKYRAGRPVTELSRLGDTKKHGTSVRFLPDNEIFGTMFCDLYLLVQELSTSAVDHPDLNIKLVDQRRFDESTGRFLQIENWSR